MNRKTLRLALGCFLLAVTVPVAAQQPKRVPRIGYLVAGTRSSVSMYIEAFRQGLADLKYIDGKNIFIEYRYADGNESRLPNLAEDLARQVDLIFVGNSGASLAAKNATSTIPIVFVLTDDPISIGLITNLAKPGGNITGLTRLSSTAELSGKRLELLKETFPKLSTVVVVWYSDRSGQFKELKVAGQALGVQVESVRMRDPDGLEKAFLTITEKHPGALIVLASSVINIHESEIVEFAAKTRLPAIYQRPEAVKIGGLMYYGPEDVEAFRRAGTYVDKILKGAKPGDLPVQQATKYQLLINLKTAQQAGFTIPPSVLYRSDKVIK